MTFFSKSEHCGKKVKYISVRNQLHNFSWSKQNILKNKQMPPLIGGSCSLSSSCFDQLKFVLLAEGDSYIFLKKPKGEGCKEQDLR